MKYARVVAEFRNRAWAVQESVFGSMLELMAKWERGEKFSEEEVELRIREANARRGFNRGEVDREMLMISGGSSRRGGGRGSGGSIVALIPIIGIISYRAQMLESISSGGGTSVERLTSQFRAALADSSVKAIVFDIDSPGGSVDGVFELAQEIYEARGRKKIVACANTCAASAAYALAAAASEVVIAPSGQAGSIGVYGSHEDHSKELDRQGVKITLVSAGKYKTEGSPLEPLSDEARAELQGKVNDYYQMFVRGVALYRNDSQTAVRSGYGQGRCVTAVKAVRAGLVDRVGTLDDVLEALGIDRKRLPSGRGAQVFDEDYTAALAHRRRQLALRSGTEVPDEDESDENCGCACAACKACTGGAGAKAGDDDMSCICGCDACKACEFKDRGASAALARRQRELDLLSVSTTGAHCPPVTEDSPGAEDYKLALRRRQMQLLANGDTHVSRDRTAAPMDWKQSLALRQRQMSLLL